MTRRIVIVLIIVVVIATVSLVLIRHGRVINSQELETAINTQLPVGTPKASVIAFIEKQHPLIYDDLGQEIKARISGLAGNMVYTKDVVLSFKFDENGRLVSHSKSETMTFF